MCRRLGCLGVGALVALTGCSSAGSPDNAPTSPLGGTASASSTPRSSASAGEGRAAVATAGAQAAWANNDIKPISQVEVASGVPVLITKAGLSPSLVGLDQQSGRVTWKRPLTSSGIEPGIDLSFYVTTSGQVAFLAPSPGRSDLATLMVVDPRESSKVVFRSSPEVFASYPTECEGSEGICLDIKEGPASGAVRLAPGSRDLQSAGPSAGEGGASIGPAGLVRYVNGNGIQHISRREGSRVIWDRSETEMFGPGFTTNGGWTFREDEKRKLIYGSVGPDYFSRARLPMSASALSFAFSRDSGKVVWRRIGIDSFCDEDVTGEAGDPWLVCQWTGGDLRVLGDKVVVKGAVFDVARVDPATGKTLWRQPVGQIKDGAYNSPKIDLTGTGAIVASGADKSVWISVAKGTSRAARPTDIGWRDQTVTMETTNPWGSRAVTARDGSVDQPVAGGKPTDRVELPFPATVGARTKNLVIVALETGVRAYPDK